MNFFKRLFLSKSPQAELTAQPGVRLITDLDLLVTQPVGFKWKGKVHFIKPMSTAVYLGLLERLARMDAIYKQGSKDHRLVIRAYAELFSFVCETIRYKDVEEMTQAQIRGLFAEIMATVTGKAQAEIAEKKTLPEKTG